MKNTSILEKEQKMKVLLALVKALLLVGLLIGFGWLLASQEDKPWESSANSLPKN